MEPRKIRLSRAQRRILDAVIPAQDAWKKAGERMGIIAAAGLKRVAVSVRAMKRKGVLDDDEQLTENGRRAWGAA